MAGTYGEPDIEDAVQAVLDDLVHSDEFLGYEDNEVTPLDIAGRVLAELRNNTTTAKD